MGLFAQSNGIHFNEPWQFQASTATATSVEVEDSGGLNQDSSTTAFWTIIAERGLQDTTNWTSDTYKTLLTVSSGKGLVGGIIGPTAGGSSTTTFRITVDGVQYTYTVPGLSSGKRAVVLAGGLIASGPVTGDAPGNNNAAVLDSGKQYFTEALNTASLVLTHQHMAAFGVPQLIFKTSLLIEAKHSASITNSTATAYSGVIYRLGITS